MVIFSDFLHICEKKYSLLLMIFLAKQNIEKLNTAWVLDAYVNTMTVDSGQYNKLKVVVRLEICYLLHVG